MKPPLEGYFTRGRMPLISTREHLVPSDNINVTAVLKPEDVGGSSHRVVLIVLPHEGINSRFHSDSREHLHRNTLQPELINSIQTQWVSVSIFLFCMLRESSMKLSKTQIQSFSSAR